MAEQFCLRWNNHQHTLVSVFENLLESETLTDCALGAEGQILKAHKVVLSACSPYFESMLCVQPEKHPIIFLKDVKYLELKAMIDYMYKGEVNISQERLDSFLKTAEALQIKGLTDQGGGGAPSGDVPLPPERETIKPAKGSSRKTGISDVAPESPLVGNVPLREGSLSPAGKRRRRTVRPSMEDVPDNSAMESNNACDNPAGDASSSPMTAVSTPMTPSHSSETARLAPVRKVEPQDTLVTPKTEIMEEPQEEIEDLTLDDDDDDYSNMSKPGTSYGNPSNLSSQEFSPWQMATTPGDRTQDEVFMAAQEAINNSQTNTQDEDDEDDWAFYEDDEEEVDVTSLGTMCETKCWVVSDDALEDTKEGGLSGGENSSAHFARRSSRMRKKPKRMLLEMEDETPNPPSKKPKAKKNPVNNIKPEKVLRDKMIKKEDLEEFKAIHTAQEKLRRKEQDFYFQELKRVLPLPGDRKYKHPKITILNEALAYIKFLCSAEHRMKAEIESLERDNGRLRVLSRKN